MNIFIVIALAVAVIAAALRLKAPVGGAILAGGLVMWVCVDRTPATLLASGLDALRQSRTYDLIFSFYFVMCLESLLRLSGTLDGMVRALNRLFSSARVTAAVMPAFLGLLPSVGGALFSAPIVEEGCRGMKVSPESKATINYWFRHVFEAGSPTIPGMILACVITGIRLGDFVLYLLWFALLFGFVGWLVLMAPLKKYDVVEKNSEVDVRRGVFDVLLAVSPVIVNVLLMMLFGLSAAVSMGIATLALGLVLKLMGREIPVGRILAGAVNRKLFLNVACILYFISLLSISGVLEQLVAALRAAPLPLPVIFAVLSFLVGALTGMSQGFIAIVMPIAAGIASGSIEYAGLAMVFGLSGQMLTPVHMCFVLSVQYFGADFFGVFKKVLLCDLLATSVYGIYAWLTWPAL